MCILLGIHAHDILAITYDIIFIIESYLSLKFTNIEMNKIFFIYVYEIVIYLVEVILFELT